MVVAGKADTPDTSTPMRRDCFAAIRPAACGSTQNLGVCEKDWSRMDSMKEAQYEVLGELF
jgi:hypothetical protein